MRLVIGGISIVYILLDSQIGCKAPGAKSGS